jgi:magnesium-transporting ATPase (P-type)
MQILNSYVRKALADGLIDEWHIWDFTRAAADHEWVTREFGPLRFMGDAVGYQACGTASTRSPLRLDARINMVTSSTLGLALAFEPSERGLMQRAPRAPNEPLLSGFFVWRVVMVSLLIAGAGIGLFLWELKLGNSLESARTIAVNAVVMCEIFYLFNSRSIFGSVLNRDALLGNRAVLVTIAICLVLQLLFTYAPPLQGVFGSVGLSPEEWLRVLLAGLALFAVAELEKWVVRRFGLHAQAA